MFLIRATLYNGQDFMLEPQSLAKVKEATVQGTALGNYNLNSRILQGVPLKAHFKVRMFCYNYKLH